MIRVFAFLALLVVSTASSAATVTVIDMEGVAPDTGAPEDRWRFSSSAENFEKEGFIVSSDGELVFVDSEFSNGSTCCNTDGSDWITHDARYPIDIYRADGGLFDLLSLGSADYTSPTRPSGDSEFFLRIVAEQDSGTAIIDLKMASPYDYTVYTFDDLVGLRKVRITSFTLCCYADVTEGFESSANFGFDNFVVQAVDPVPAPASIILALSGLGLLIGRKRLTRLST